jgi:hypothetical protein
VNYRFKVAFAATLIAIMIGATYAVIKYTSTITNSMTIKGYEIKLWRTDNAAEVLTISWGEVDTDTSKTSDDALGLPTSVHKLAIQNLGDYETYVGWQIDPATPLPAGVTITGHHANMETEPYQQTWGESTFTFLVPAKSVSLWRVRWTLTIGSDVDRGDCNFNILLLAANSPTG